MISKTFKVLYIKIDNQIYEIEEESQIDYSDID